MPTISIIVPIYNAEKTLRKCLESILRQRFSDYEVLLINDGSKDRSAEICQEYVSKDVRFKYFYQENSGVSAARNVGIDCMQGEWVTFVDSDDMVGEWYLYHLYRQIESDVDLIIAYPQLIYADKHKEVPSYSAGLFSRDSFHELFIKNDLHKFTSPWAKLYKTSIIHGEKLKFCKGMNIGEDLLFLFSYMHKVCKIYVSSSTEYMYLFEGENSLTKKINIWESEYDGYLNIINVIDSLINHWQIKSDAALDCLGWIKGYYVRRVLNAVYHSSDMNAEQRVALIKKLDILPYYKYLHIPAKREYLLAWLLKSRMYIIYDMVRVIAKELRLLKSFMK